MADVSSNVYDILFPSPPVLKDIAAISIALQLWRQEINAHRIKNTLNELNLRRNILPSNSIPRKPPTILSLIREYVKRVGLSIQQWLEDHFASSSSRIRMLKDFMHFVADFDGSIHYVRTAKRLVRCGRVEKMLRFSIACKYFFEEDILRIWPSVSSDYSLKWKTSSCLFHTNSEVNYWVCRLRNQLYKFPRSFNSGRSIEEEVFTNSLTHIFTNYASWSFVEYFWNRFDSDTRIRILTEDELRFHKHYRYLLSKFSDVELDKFTNTNGYLIIYNLLGGGCNIVSIDRRTCDKNYIKGDVQYRASYILAIWAYIKDRMSGTNFFLLVRKIIRNLHHPPASTPICCKIWNTASDHLKKYAIRKLLREDSLIETYSNTLPINANFLTTVLSDALAQERSTFWSKHWRELINVTCTSEYDKLIRLCFSTDENEINEFKLNSLSALASVRSKCSILLNNVFIQELNEFLIFCYPDEETRKNMRLNLLVEKFKIDAENISKISPVLNDFINDAYNEPDFAADFKTQLLRCPSTKEIFTQLIDSYSYGTKFHHELQFIDILAPSKQVARDLKKLYRLPLLKQKLVTGIYKQEVEKNEFSNFISEFSCSENEIALFKSTLAVDDIVQFVIRCVIATEKDPEYNPILLQFLEWYFTDSQKLKQFKKKYAGDDVFVQLTTKSSE